MVLDGQVRQNIAAWLVEPLVRAWGFLGGTPRVPDDGEIAAALARVGWRHVALDSAAGTLRLAGPEVRIDLGGIASNLTDVSIDAFTIDGASSPVSMRSSGRSGTSYGSLMPVNSGMRPLRAFA